MVTQYLTELEPKDDWAWGEGELSIDGNQYVRALWTKSSGCVDPMSLEYVIGRDWDRVRFTAGFGDESEDNAKALFEVYADKTLVFEEKIGYGAHETATRSVKDALTLRLVVTMLEGTDGDCARPGHAAFGDANLTRR